MRPIAVMVNGLPGNMAANVVRHVLTAADMRIVPYSLTGPEIADREHRVDDLAVTLLSPGDRDDRIPAIIEAHGPFICVDYTHPTAVNANAEFYCRHALPFVMGTTGGERQRLAATVQTGSVAAVIAPNMAKQIVGLQAMMAYAAENFPGLFSGYRLEVKESHQQGKADTSGTAKAMVAYFNAMGVPFDSREIVMERDPARQAAEWHIPPAHLGGHGWHTYALDSEDRSVHFEFRHNVNGRDVYARGTLDAVRFLHGRLEAGGAAGRVYSMIDVLKG